MHCEATTQNRDDILEGEIKCRHCGSTFPVVDGILRFDIADKRVLREVAQWEVFADSEGWLELNELYLESLPSSGSNVLMKGDTIGWMGHEYNFFRVLKSLCLKDKSILDLGAGRCWSSKWMALVGGEVVAFDAMTHPSTGLGAGAVFLKNHNLFFERVAGDFNDLPFRDGVFDIVFSTGSLHHSVDIHKTVSQASRVLKSKGLLAIASEPVSSFRRTNEEVKLSRSQDGINEHAYRMIKWLVLFRSNNLKLHAINESLHVYDPDSIFYQGVLASAISKTKWGKLLYLILRGGVLNCIMMKTA
jgi:ubiquinone/menaquinone biosynthesis C-methylase UbiE